MFARRSFFAFISVAVAASAPAQQSPSTAKVQPSPSATPTAGSASASPSSTPIVFSQQILTDLRRLQQAALNSDYAYRQVAHLANNIGPRLSGSAQAAKAVEYVASELKAIGCEVQLEKVMVPHWVRGDETAALVRFPEQVENTAQKIVLTALGGSAATAKEGFTAEVVVVKNSDELKALPRDKVAGKIVLFNYPFDKQMAAEGGAGDAYQEAVVYRNDGPSEVAKLGAAVALLRSVGGADYRLPHTGNTKFAEGVARIPAAAVTAEDADLIASLTKQGPVLMRVLLTPEQFPDVVSYNVIGDLKGSEHPEQVVIVSGHLDSWDLGTGALDDGAGVAVSMQAANIIRQLGLHPRRTIRVIAWMNEENGLMGAKTYATDHENEMANHFAAIETDGGAGHPLGINMRTKPEVKLLLASVAKVLQDSGAGALHFTEEAGADIEPLEKMGVPTFSPIQDSRSYFSYHHTAADTLDKIVPKELGENAAVVAVLAYALANIEQTLKP